MNYLDIEPAGNVDGSPYWTVGDVVASIKSKLADDPDNQEIKSDLATMEQIAAEGAAAGYRSPD